MSKYPWLISTIVFTILILGAARMHELWGDEAETALFGRNIVKYAVPRGWDGTNIMGINNAVVLDKNLINHTSPWLQYYLVALSFKLFGESSFTARLPFIILAILTQPLLYFVAKKITGDKLAAILASIISAFSVQGILFAYQARYYQATNFLGLLFLWSAWNISFASPPRRWGWGFWSLIFVISAGGFFYANYVSFAAFFAATIISVLIYTSVNKQKDISKYIFRIGLLTLPVVAVTLPWYLIVKPFVSRGAISVGSLAGSLMDFLSLFWEGLFQFHYNNTFPAGLVILLLLIIVYKIVKKQPLGILSFCTLLPLIYLGIMSLFSTVALVDTVFVHGRYTTVVLPFLYLLAGLILAFFWRINKWMTPVIICLFLFTNTLKFTPRQSYFGELITEIIYPYQTPEPLVADFLKNHSQPGQTAFVNLDRDHEPLIYLLGDRLKFVNRVSLINTRIFPANRGVIPRYIYDFRGEPDWVILYGKRGKDGTFFTMDSRELPPEVDLTTNYLEHKLPIFFSDLSRPEIDHRSFSEIIPTNPVDFVYIYEKKQTAAKKIR